MSQLKIAPKQMGITSSQIQNICIKDISLDDFPAKAKQGYFLAHIYWGINYKFVPRTIPTKQNYPLVAAQPSISPKSWINQKCADRQLLQHQYGHYLIACWCALDFQQTVNYQYGILFKGNNVQQYKNWCNEIFQKMMKKYCVIQRKYDQQTAHYCNQEEQEIWQKKIVANINQFDKKSKQRKSVQKMQNIKNDGRQLKKIQNKRAFSHNNSKKIKINSGSLFPGNQNSTAYRIRQPNNIPKPIKII